MASFAGPLFVGRLLSGAETGGSVGDGWVLALLSVVLLNLIAAAFFAVASTAEYLD